MKVTCSLPCTLSLQPVYNDPVMLVEASSGTLYKINQVNQSMRFRSYLVVRTLVHPDCALADLSQGRRRRNAHVLSKQVGVLCLLLL